MNVQVPVLSVFGRFHLDLSCCHRSFIYRLVTAGIRLVKFLLAVTGVGHDRCMTLSTYRKHKSPHGTDDETNDES